jgi:hypothetical protein
MRVVLVFGCWGREKDGFVSCGGVTNDILDITAGSERNTAIAEYLDSHFSMFDRPLYNNVHTVLWNLQEKFGVKGNPVFEEKKFKRMEEFCMDHRKCGLFLRLDIREESIG